MSDDANSWRDHSRFVLSALERLDKQLDALRIELSRASVDISRHESFATTIGELDKRIREIQKDIADHESDVKEAVKSLEQDDQTQATKTDEKLSAIDKKLDELFQYMHKSKTVAWIIASIVGAIVGMFGLDLKDILK